MGPGQVTAQFVGALSCIPKRLWVRFLIRAWTGGKWLMFFLHWCFSLFKNQWKHILGWIFLIFYWLFREGEKEREMWEIHLLVVSYKCLMKWRLKPQLRHVSWQKNQLTTFLCMGGCTNQLGHTGQSPPSGEDF